MDFGAKVRAGRAILSWTRDDLAAASTVSAPAIKNIETGASSPTATTQRHICRAFENEGVFFAGQGVEHRVDRIRFFSDFLEVLEDAQASLKKGEELLLHCADERKNTPEVTGKIAELSRAGIVLRLTIETGNRAITTDPANYRTIDPALVESAEVSVIYADKYVLHVPDGERDIYILIKNRPLAAVRRREFEYWWKKGAPYVAA